MQSKYDLIIKDLQYLQDVKIRAGINIMNVFTAGILKLKIIDSTNQDVIKEVKRFLNYKSTLHEAANLIIARQFPLPSGIQVDARRIGKLCKQLRYEIINDLNFFETYYKLVVLLTKKRSCRNYIKNINNFILLNWRK